jgi:hypothetical protein
MMIPDSDGEGGGTGGGGGGTPTGPYASLSPKTITVAAPGTPVTIIPYFGNTGAMVLNPGAIPCTTGLPIVVTPDTTTTYTMTDGTTSATCVVTVGGVATATRRWLDIRWDYTEPQPAGSCVGFEVLICLGSDITLTDNWVEPPIQVPATDRRLVYPLTLIPPKQITWAVRPKYVYAQRVADWIALSAPLTFQ